MDDYKERYRRIGESEWFKQHYDGKSLGDSFDAGDVCTNPIEQFIKGVYAEQIKRKPTFDENMQEQIKRELERLVEEAKRLKEDNIRDDNC